MTNKQKLKVSKMVVDEMRWMHEHPELVIPQWYINLILSAEQRLLLNDFDGAAYDIEQAVRGRYESMGVCI